MGKQQRRSAGEGNIRQRADGRWEARLDLGIVNGKREVKSVYGPTRAAVVRAMHEAQQAQQQGLDLSADQLTVDAFLQHWLEHTVKSKNRARTYADYRGTVRRWITPHVGRFQLQKLAATHVEVMIAALQAQKLGPASVSKAHTVLKRVLNVAVRRGYVARNVAQLVDVPRPQVDERPVLTLAQARQLLAAVAGTRWEALYRVLLSLGLRRGEVLGLLWVDVDLEAATLRITGALQRVEGKRQRTAPKTPRSATTLPLPAALVVALRQHEERQRVARARKGE